MSRGRVTQGTGPGGGPAAWYRGMHGPARLAVAAGGLAAALGTAAGLAFVAHLFLRPPCPPNWVRFLDFEAPLAWVSFSLAAAGAAIVLGVAYRQRRRPSTPPRLAAWVLGSATLVLVPPALLLAFLAGSTLATNALGGCFTF